MVEPLDYRKRKGEGNVLFTLFVCVCVGVFSVCSLLYLHDVVGVEEGYFFGFLKLFLVFVA